MSRTRAAASSGAGPERFTVRTDARVMTAEQIAAIPVKFAGGVLPLQVRDLARVVTGAAPRQGAATQNGRETVLGTVMMLVGQNSRETALRVQDALPEISAALPKGMVIDRQYSRADLVDQTIHTVERNLGEGALLVAIVLLFVMGNWRAALIVALVIPLAFLVTVSGMHAIGLSGNLMSLGALDFGLIVDGAIVVVENSLHCSPCVAPRRARTSPPTNAATRWPMPPAWSRDRPSSASRSSRSSMSPCSAWAGSRASCSSRWRRR